MAKSMLHTHQGIASHFARFVFEGAQINNEHVGGRLMDSLRPEVADVVREMEFNPRFIDDMILEDVIDWLNDHIVFDNRGSQIGIVDDGELLWEADKHGR